MAVVRRFLKAAVTLRDSTGRDRLPVMRQMCTVWGLSRREKIHGQWKDRTLATLQELLSNAVCLAATRWQAEQPIQTKQRGDPDHTAPDPVKREASPSEAGAAKKAQTDTADTVPSSGNSGLSWAQLEQRAIALPQTSEDVMELRRLGPDLFEATKRSGESWVGDAELLRTLPQGTAKLATVEVQELMRARKAKATRAQNVAGAASAGGKSTEPPAKRPRTLQERFGR